MHKEVSMTPRIQKLWEAIQAFHLNISFVRGIHNKISDPLSRAPVGDPEGIENVLRNLRGTHCMPTTR